MPCLCCVGYRRVWEMLEGTPPRAELLESSIYATRQFAKRQLTWLRSMKDIGVVDPLEPATANRVLQKIGTLK